MFAFKLLFIKQIQTAHSPASPTPLQKVTRDGKCHTMEVEPARTKRLGNVGPAHDLTSHNKKSYFAK